MDGESLSDVQHSYDAVADEYTERIYAELRHKPRDREILDKFGKAVRDFGIACDFGCGPGHVACYLHDRNVPVMGIDLSSAMVETARRRNPGIEFRQADIRRSGFADETIGGIVAFYSIIHIPRSEVVATLSEMRRVVRPGGLLLLAFHIGDTVLHLDELFGKRVSLDFVFFETSEMSGFLEQAGLEVVEAIEREPYPNVEYPSRRAYVLARKPIPSS